MNGSEELEMSRKTCMEKVEQENRDFESENPDQGWLGFCLGSYSV